ncbi:pseudouridine synthase [Streptococcus oricebi]|uniref:Pseudouridine synthase n=1 Tax=Streptococcus oricebi TaxID=1547447 RepID=A0ABS5B495_9STRE|nr:pseudouridine synthase [Streptococcus oricebi]MBP2623642.1 16S rRNA pseudouridine(516) synthase [Streptococcus oricebi]
MRLDKFLAGSGLGSRSQVKQVLKNKQIRLNGQIEKQAKTQVDPLLDDIRLDGQKLSYQKYLYYLLNKPSGFLSATEDRTQATVLDLLDDEARQRQVFPVGRLDRDTRGLLLLTNNGPLAHALLSPKRHVEKTYLAQVAGIMTAEDQTAFAGGLALKDFTCQPASLKILDQDLEKETCLVEITISEGKHHQVKRMVQARGKTVTDLKRLSMGPLELDSELAEGDYRSLTASELASLEVYGLEL